VLVGLAAEAATVEEASSFIDATRQLVAVCSGGAVTGGGDLGLVTANDDWTPVEEDFDGVTMVQVPTGCFMMGSDDPNAETDEVPVHEVCIEDPFWLDKFEVTQGQWDRLGATKAEPMTFFGDNLPVNNIDYFEALAFCEMRGMRLPTEAEWEWAARGPDSLLYPWGEEWVDDNAVHSGNSGDRAAPVGSHPAGVSWVGAMDMAGNVWEWTNSEGMPYPYDADDGREEIAQPDDSYQIRGGSYDFSSVYHRSSNRFDWRVGSPWPIVGLRCAQDAP
jgi:formylglycine-generating enzyme required for sulfatase activity